MTTQTAVTPYAIDPAHSSVEFAVKHMMVSTVKGVFRDFEGTLHIDEADPAQSWVEATIRTASVDTGLGMRDDDLRSDNFLSVDSFPVMTFRSTSVEKVSDDRWLV